MLRVLLVDDHMIIRTIVRKILEKTADMRVIFMAFNGQEAVDAALDHRPDVVVMDLSMPVMDGVEATKKIGSVSPETRILVVSAYDTPEHIRRSIEAGALGYVLKDVLNRDLVKAVRALHQGNRYFSEQIAELAKPYIE